MDKRKGQANKKSEHDWGTLALSRAILGEQKW
jgi:hypothetical protein